MNMKKKRKEAMQNKKTVTGSGANPGVLTAGRMLL